MITTVSAIKAWTPMSFILLLSLSVSQAPTAAPRFEDYPANTIFRGKPRPPKIVTDLEQRYAIDIKDGVEKGFGAFRDGKEQIGPNFAGELIVIHWSCGSPCIRMVILNARTGDIFYPPISIIGVGANSFDLPILMKPGVLFPQNPVFQFRTGSNLMTIEATPDSSKPENTYTYYFAWNRDQWRLVKKVPVREIVRRPM